MYNCCKATVLSHDLSTGIAEVDEPQRVEVERDRGIYMYNCCKATVLSHDLSTGMVEAIIYSLVGKEKTNLPLISSG